MAEHDGILDAAALEAHRAELGGGRRFGFGRNWRSYAAGVDAEAVAEAERSLLVLLEPSGDIVDGRLDGIRMLDAGCGSGLFSLAALRLGARVVAFDFDPDSVLTTRDVVAGEASLGPLPAERFTLLHGSVLDDGFVGSLGRFDLVYSWGVLHHTGAMWDACRNVADAVRPGGTLAIALYHDAGAASRVWWAIKRLSAALPRPLQHVLALLLLLPIELYALLRALLRFDPASYVHRWTRYRSLRGMSRWHDHLDWVGGFPYEWASPEDVIDFHRGLGFDHLRTVDAIAWGCNEFVFRRRD